MSITNGYTTLALLKAELGIPTSTTVYDTRAEAAAAAASRQIDGHCGRRFWQDGSVVPREYFAEDAFTVYTDDISTATGLVVKIDDTDAGTFATTLTVSTHFILLPTNAADKVPVWPWSEIRVVDTVAGSFPMSGSGRPGVQVTAKFGWPAVPDDVAKACLVQATQLYKAADAVFGGLSVGDAGFMRVQASLNPLAVGLLEPYVRRSFVRDAG